MVQVQCTKSYLLLTTKSETSNNKAAQNFQARIMDTFKRYFFIIFNILYVILGLLLLLFSVWLQFGSPIHEIATEMQGSELLVYMTIAVGSVLAILGLVGIFGTFYANKCLLIIYVIIVTLFILVEVGVGVYITVVQLFGDGMIITLEVWDKMDQSSKDGFQKRFQCCGFQNATAENIISNNSTTSFPCSCFRNETLHKNDNETCETGSGELDEIYQIGCYDRVQEWVENNIYTVIAIASVILFFELCQVVVASLLVKAVSRNQRTRPMSRRSPSHRHGSRSPNDHHGGHHHNDHHHQHSDYHHQQQRRSTPPEYHSRNNQNRHKHYTNSTFIHET